MPAHPLCRDLIYFDWYDGLISGLGIDSADRPVAITMVDATRDLDKRAFLVRVIPYHVFSAVQDSVRDIDDLTPELEDLMHGAAEEDPAPEIWVTDSFFKKMYVRKPAPPEVPPPWSWELEDDEWGAFLATMIA